MTSAHPDKSVNKKEVSSIKPMHISTNSTEERELLLIVESLYTPITNPIVVNGLKVRIESQDEYTFKPKNLFKKHLCTVYSGLIDEHPTTKEVDLADYTEIVWRSRTFDKTGCNAFVLKKESSPSLCLAIFLGEQLTRFYELQGENRFRGFNYDNEMILYNHNSDMSKPDSCPIEDVCKIEHNNDYYHLDLNTLKITHFVGATSQDIAHIANGICYFEKMYTAMNKPLKTDKPISTFVSEQVVVFEYDDDEQIIIYDPVAHKPVMTIGANDLVFCKICVVAPVAETFSVAMAEKDKVCCQTASGNPVIDDIIANMIIVPTLQDRANAIIQKSSGALKRRESVCFSKEHYDSIMLEAIKVEFDKYPTVFSVRMEPSAGLCVTCI